MKKLFVILMTLALILALPLCVMAEELSESTAEVITGEAMETTAEETTAEETTDEAVETIVEETETEYEMDFGFYPDTLRTTLPIMGMGMLGIFLVTCIIVLAVVVLSKFGKQKEE